MENIVIVYEFGSVISGAAKVAIHSAIELKKRGYRVFYFCAVGPVDKDLKQTTDKVICLNQYDILHDPSRVNAIVQGIWNKRAYKELKHLLSGLDKNKTVVNIHGYSHTLSSSIFKACKDEGISPFLTLHEYFSVCPNGGFFNYPKKSICTLEPMSKECVCTNCDVRSFPQKCYRVLRQAVQDRYIRFNTNIRYIYLSNFSFSHMEKYLSSKKHYYLHNPIDKYNIDSVNTRNNITYTFIGRNSPEKGLDLFCEAINDLGLEGLVIGDGDSIDEYRNKYKTINFVGWKDRESIIPYIKKTRCLVFPSIWYEVSPLTTEECLTVGIPCIVPDQCAAKDQIKDGINGYLFKMMDLESLKEKIMMVENEESDLLFQPEKWPILDVDTGTYIDKLIKIYSKD